MNDRSALGTRECKVIMTFCNLLFTVGPGRSGSGRTPRHPKTAQSAVPWLAAVLLAACGAPAGDPAGGRNPGTHAAEGYGDAIASARALIDSLMEAQGIPGMSVAVGRGPDVIWSEGFGYSDLTHQVRVTPETRFRIGSVSKPFTAAAVAHLVEDGALDLDAPVGTYVPVWPAKRWPVTTRQLAGHIGGVRHYRGRENFSMASYPDVLSGLAIFQDDSLISEPGTEYSYSSYGWNLISAVVEGASGEPFLDYMDDVVFGPLEMSGTMADEVRPVIPHRTRFYVRGEDGGAVNAPYVDNSYKWAGGGFLSTPEDMLRFANAHSVPGYLEAETLELLFASQTLADGSETGYGIGWRSTANDHGESIVSHTGGSVGGITVMTLNRDTGVIVAIVANLSQARLGNGLAARVEELFHQD